MLYENQKLCGTCQQLKPHSGFTKYKGRKDGLNSQCKECQHAYNKKYYIANRGKVIAANRKYYDNNRKACLAARKKYAKTHKKEYRDYSRERNRKERRLPIPTRACPTHCEMCSQPAGERALHLDHCHQTGEFRGWLCGSCNMAFGRLGDSFEEVIRRLEKYKSIIDGSK